MTAKKRQHNIWARWLAKALALITWCERCHARPGPDYLDTAHRLKRDLIGWRTEDDRAEYMTAVKLCRNCHIELEEATGEDVHQEMFEEVTRIRLGRDPSLVPESMPYPPFIEWDAPRIYGSRR